MAVTGGVASDDPERKAIKSFLDGLRRTEASGSGGVDAALRLAGSLGSPVVAAMKTAVRLSASASLAAAATISQPPVVLLFTDNTPRPPMVTVRVANPLAVKKAKVTVDVFDEEDYVVASEVPLNDNGEVPDTHAHDGIYSASLAGIITTTGQYAIVATASNPAGAAVYGSVIAGADESTIANKAINEQFNRTSRAYLDYAAPSATGTNAAGDGGSGSSNCFIATAAYGSYLDPHVQALRRFRDTWLMTNYPGRLFVALYYTCSPPLAEFISRHETLRAVTRWALTPLVLFASHSSSGMSFLLVIGIAGVTRTRKKGGRKD